MNPRRIRQPIISVCMLGAVVCALAVFGPLLVRDGTAGYARATDAATAPSTVLARGRYLVAYGACNDCHTPGWAESDGRLAQSQWLTGSSVGFRGAWGTSYPVNLRLEFQALDESQWIDSVRQRGGHPPMVWHDLRVLTPADRHAIYAFVKSLGPAGVQVPPVVPPWREPRTRYIDTRPRDPMPSPT